MYKQTFVMRGYAVYHDRFIFIAAYIHAVEKLQGNTVHK